MFFNVDMCKTVVIAGEITDSATIFIELLKFFCEVLLFLGSMCMSRDLSELQLPLFIYALTQNAILRVLRKKNCEVFFNVS